MRNAILILAGTDFHHLLKLIDYFKTDCELFIHIDKKSIFTPSEIRRLKALPNVKAVFQKYTLHSGGYHTLKCELFLMKQAWMKTEADYFHLISGQDYPLKPLSSFLGFFERQRNRFFIAYKRLPHPDWDERTYRRYQYFYLNDWFDPNAPKGRLWLEKIVKWQKKRGIKRAIPDHLNYLYGGSAWFSVPREGISYILDYTRSHPRFKRRLKYTLAPEETYIHTLLNNSGFTGRITNLNLRFSPLESGSDSVSVPLIESHFKELASTKAMFAQPFDSRLSETVISWIDKYLLTESTLVFSETGCWQQAYLTSYLFDTFFCEALARACELMEVKHAVDLGCGPGLYVSALRDRGIPTQGYDGNPQVKEISSLILNGNSPCETVDLTVELPVKKPVDLVLCLNVGEYVPVEYEEILIRNLINHTGKYLILSWAYTGNPEQGIRNPRSTDYLLEKLSHYGFYQDVPTQNFLRERASSNRLKETLLVLEK